MQGSSNYIDDLNLKRLAIGAGLPELSGADLDVLYSLIKEEAVKAVKAKTTKARPTIGDKTFPKVVGATYVNQLSWGDHVVSKPLFIDGPQFRQILIFDLNLRLSEEGYIRAQRYIENQVCSFIRKRYRAIGRVKSLKELIKTKGSEKALSLSSIMKKPRPEWEKPISTKKASAKKASAKKVTSGRKVSAKKVTSGRKASAKKVTSGGKVSVKKVTSDNKVTVRRVPVRRVPVGKVTIRRTTARTSEAPIERLLRSSPSSRAEDLESYFGYAGLFSSPRRASSSTESPSSLRRKTTSSPDMSSAVTPRRGLVASPRYASPRKEAPSAYEETYSSTPSKRSPRSLSPKEKPRGWFGGWF